MFNLNLMCSCTVLMLKRLQEFKAYVHNYRCIKRPPTLSFRETIHIFRTLFSKLYYDFFFASKSFNTDIKQFLSKRTRTNATAKIPYLITGYLYVPNIANPARRNGTVIISSFFCSYGLTPSQN